MPFDFNKVKQNLSADKLKSTFAKKTTPQPVVAPVERQQAESADTFLARTKQGLKDVKAVFQEGKFTLFTKQFVALLIVFLLVHWAYGKLAKKRGVINDQISAIEIQQTNKEDYLINKDRLMHLEPLFPDIAEKDEWLLKRLIEIRDTYRVNPDLNGNVTMTDNPSYTVASQTISLQQKFNDFGNMVAGIENGDPFLRISEFSITKLMAPESLGENTISFKINTVFPQDKFSPRLFKDYAQQMEKIQAEREAVKKAPVSTTQPVVEEAEDEEEEPEPVDEDDAI